MTTTNKELFEFYGNENQAQGTTGVQAPTQNQGGVTQAPQGATGSTAPNFVFNELSDNSKTLTRFLDDEDVDIRTCKIKGVEKECKVLKTPLKIKEVTIMKPRIEDMDGNYIPPRESRDKTKKFYDAKVEMIFETDKPYKALIPNVKWFVNKNILNPSIRTDYRPGVDPRYVSDINVLYHKFCDAYGYDKTKKDINKILTQAQFLKEMVGKYIMLVEENGFDASNNEYWKLMPYKFVDEKGNELGVATTTEAKK